MYIFKSKVKLSKDKLRVSNLFYLRSMHIIYNCSYVLVTWYVLK